MRIVICDYSGHPFQVELSRALAGRGHGALHLHYAEFQTPKGNLVRLPGDPPGFAVEGISIGRSIDKGRLVRRRMLESAVGRRLAARALAFRPDVVVGCNMPLDGGKYLQRACRRSGTPFVFWVQDLYCKAIQRYVTANFGPLGRLLDRHYTRLESGMLRQSDAVVAISESFLPELAHWGVPRERITVVANWAPLSEIGPRPKDNEWARRHGFDRRLVALYTGTLGLKHDPKLLLELARRGAPSEFSVAVASEGPGAEFLERARMETGFDNLQILPFQPMEAYPDVLGAGDVLVAILDESAASFSVPSKILSYLAAGKPIVAAIDAGNDAARLIRDAEAGIVVRPRNTTEFADAAASLLANAAERRRLGENARRFAAARFAVTTIADRFEAIFARLVPPSRTALHRDNYDLTFETKLTNHV